MEILYYIFKTESEEIDGTSDGYVLHPTKLKIYVNAVHPELNFVIKIYHKTDSKYLQFSLEAWNKLIENEQNIRSALSTRREEETFISKDLKSFTEFSDGAGFLCLLDETGTKISLTHFDFQYLLTLSPKLYDEHARLVQQVTTTTKQFNAILNLVSNLSERGREEFGIKLKSFIDKLGSTVLATKVLKVEESSDSSDNESDRSGSIYRNPFDYYDEDDKEDVEYDEW